MNEGTIPMSIDINKAVNDFVRYITTPEMESELLSAQYVRQVRLELLTLKRSCESQLAQDRAERLAKRVECLGEPNGKGKWLDYLVDRERWRSGVIRFKGGIENRLDQVSEVIVQMNDTSLLSAIEDHRERVMNGDDEELDDADNKLWEVLA